MAVSADATATITELKATPGVGSVTLTSKFTDPHMPNGLPYLKTDKIVYVASETNDRSTATEVAEGFTSAKHDELSIGQVWYYWARARRGAGEYGEYYPAGETSGVEARVAFDDNAFVSIFPVVTSLFGSITDYYSSGFYNIAGRLISVFASVTIVDNGSGSGQLQIELPFVAHTPALGVAINATSEMMGIATIGISALNFMTVAAYDGNYPVVTGDVIHAQVTYQLPP